ncbi:LysR family transcriptional regulator [Corynebacterium sp. MSK044]|uniref:LysR family transcriptional regulator n=1 Tax=Corynebacterium sp. MSK044 TaxID=3050195 RepID=UPI00254E82F7|nr:LysR family transcriptional regulator [Corynebacterium sp. MSK044]MDK8797244.1 LysR family transcriptional regulator [Corynebacterium sp. MSK044]
MLRIAFVTGTEPGKWFARYRETTDHGLEELPSDDPFALVETGEADLALMRLDDRIGEPGETYHRVGLYSEAPGVAVPKDSVFAEMGEKLAPREFAGEIINFTYKPDSLIDDLRSALQVVAANVGIAYAPAPLLKVLSKKQVAVVDLTSQPEGMEPTEIGLVWKISADSDAIQDFVGVAKGRTRNSSRASSREAKKPIEQKGTQQKNLKKKSSQQRGRGAVGRRGRRR